MGQRSARYYTNRTLKILWGRAAGRCAVASCRVELYVDATDYDPMVGIGEIAHIEAASDRGPRANLLKPANERDEYDNLILLCKNCHARFDGQKQTNTVEAIRKLKAEHEEWVRNSLPERGRSTIGWSTILLQGAQPFDLESVTTALSPDFPSGAPLALKVHPDQESWDDIHRRLEQEISTLFNAGDPFDFRLAVFPLAPVSACIALGYYLTSRPRVRLFQYHRDDHSWAWPNEQVSVPELTVTGLPNDIVTDAGELAFCFHLSAPIDSTALDELELPFVGRVHVTIPCPSTAWLQHPNQLKELGRVARGVFEASAVQYPNVTRWHLFCAVAAPAAVLIGQQLNPTMSATTQLYEFRRDRQPMYQPSVSLGGVAEG